MHQNTQLCHSDTLGGVPSQILISPNYHTPLLLIYFSLPITLLMNYFGQRMAIKTLKSGSMTVENKYEMKY